MFNTLSRLLDAIAALLLLNRRFLDHYRNEWWKVGNQRKSPRGWVCTRKGELALSETSRVYRETRRRAEAEIRHLRKALYEAYRLCRLAGLDLGWADRILEEVRTLGDDIAVWSCWTHADQIYNQDLRRLYPESGGASVAFLPPESAEAQHWTFHGRRYELSYQLTKLISAAGDFLRLRFDHNTYTVIVDEFQYSGIDPNAFLFLEALWLRGPGRWPSKDIVGTSFEGLEPSKLSRLVSDAFARLPAGLHEILNSTTAGHAIRSSVRANSA